MGNEPFTDLIGTNTLIHQPSTAGRFRYECIRCAVIGKAGRMAAVEFESYLPNLYKVFGAGEGGYICHCPHFALNSDTS